jgi:SAM-dependent methyltransferase
MVRRHECDAPTSHAISVINQLLYRLRRPERGWDPIPAAHAEVYASGEWAVFSEDVIDDLEQRLGPFVGRRVLDLGGGPGQYSVGFARRGAIVTWHDISRRYEEIVLRHAQAEGVTVRTSLGYLEDAARLGPDAFDLVFVRVCWNYCMSDRGLARVVYRLVAPGGAAYVDSQHMVPALASWRRHHRYTYLLNRYLWLKIGHPAAPPGRIARLFEELGAAEVTVDPRSADNDRVLAIKRG